MNKRILVQALAIANIAIAAPVAMAENFWQQPNLRSIEQIKPDNRATEFRAMQLDFSKLVEFSRQQADVMELDLPLPDGRFLTFAIADNGLMPAELKAKYPSIRAYNGYALNDP